MKIRFLLSILLYILFMSSECAAPQKTDYFTCEFDLVSEDGRHHLQPWKPAFMDSACLNIYWRRGGDPKPHQMYLNEANAFAEFMKTLEMYEVKKSGVELCANRNYAIYFDDRKEFYKKSKVIDCYKKNNKEAFLDCLTNKRKELTDIINNS